MSSPTIVDRCRQVTVVVAVTAGILLGITGDYGSDGPLLVDSEGDADGSPVVPAGYAFFIWGPIYLGALAFAAYQARPSAAADALLRRVGWPAAAAFLGQGLWSRTAGLGRLWPILLLVAVTVAVAALAYGRLSSTTVTLGRAHAWLVRAPLALHLGWLTLAAVLTTTESLTLAGVDGRGLGTTTWAVLVLLLAGVIAVAATARAPGSLAYPAAVVWGLVAIVVEQFPVDATIGTTAAVAAVTVLGVAVRSELATAGTRRSIPRSVRPGRRVDR